MMWTWACLVLVWFAVSGAAVLLGKAASLGDRIELAPPGGNFLDEGWSLG